MLDRESAEFFLRTKAAIFPGMKIAEIFGVSEGPLYEQMKHNILQVNGADHSRLRGLVNPALSPRAVERYRPAMRDFLEGLLEESVARGRGRDERGLRVRGGVREAVPVPGDRRGDGRAARGRAAAAPLVELDPAPVRRRQHGHRGRADRAGGGGVLRVRPGAPAARRQTPGEDLISKLIAAEEEGDRLSESECINLVFNVLVGGVDTSQSQLAHTMRLLAEDPEQWAALRARSRPRRATAVEEALRYEPITPFTARILTEEVVYRDVSFPEGSVVIVCAFTGNRDLDDESERRPLRHHRRASGPPGGAPPGR